MHKETLLDLGELSQLCIPCRRCKTKVLLDSTDYEANVPEQCPSCGNAYDQAFRAALQGYRNAWRKLTDPDARSVQVRVTSDE